MLGALTGARVKQAATQRVFGFEIMPAPFVVAHLQVGLTMQALDAPLSEDGDERAGVFLTNALTGWEPTDAEAAALPGAGGGARPGRAGEAGHAGAGHPGQPALQRLRGHGGGRGTGTVRSLPHHQGEVRTSRRPGVERPVRPVLPHGGAAHRGEDRPGVVCFISNYSWLDGLSFTGMRERYLEAFDAIRIDCLNGDRFKTGKTTPEGEPDPSIFSTPEDPVGIQVGTAIATLVRRTDHEAAQRVDFRHLWGQSKPDDLTATAEGEPDDLYGGITPLLSLGLPFADLAVSDGWQDWPALPDLFPTSFPGVKTSRDGFLVDVDLDRLKQRVADYFDAELNHEEIARRYPSVMKSTARFDARAVRDALLKRGGPYRGWFCPLCLPPTRHPLALLGRRHKAAGRKAC